VPVEDSKGVVVRDAAGVPLLHWVDAVQADRFKIKGFGIEISFGS